jgi:hypothetical protein
MTTAREKWLKEQQRMKEYAALWPNKDDDRFNYPVIVEYTFRHVVWVEADDAQRAVDRLLDEPYEYTNDQETLCSSDWKVKAPDQWDWDDVYEGDYYGAYRGLECNAHVEERRRWMWVLNHAHQQATAENEDLDGVQAEQRKTCAVCREWREDGHEDKFSHQLEVRSGERRAQEAVAR